MVGIIVSTLLSAAACGAATRLGPRLGYVDRPDDSNLKVHVQPAVPLGGVGIFAGVHVGLAAAGLFDGWLFTASAILLALGLADDRAGLAPGTRLAVESIAGVILAAGVAPALGWAGAAIVGLALVVSVNAINLFDGLDGLVGASALVTALSLAVLAAIRGLDYLPGLIVAGALVGFLLVNWHPARVFLGDNGSYSLAAYLVAGIAAVSATSSSLPDLLVGLGLLGVFLIDLASTVLRRFFAKQPLFLGDRNHSYDRLHAQGRSVPAVAVITAVAQLLLAGAIIALTASVTPWWAVGLVVTIGAAAVLALAVGPWLPATPDPGI